MVAVCGYVPALGAVDRRDLGAGGLVGHLDLCGARDCIEAKCASSECWVCLETSSLEVGIRSAWSGAVGGHTESEAEQQKPDSIHRFLSIFLRALGRSIPLYTRLPAGL